jgi:hypothetical protein
VGIATISADPVTAQKQDLVRWVRAGEDLPPGALVEIPGRLVAD